MKLKTLLTTIVLGLSLTTASYANDINLSWSINTLKGQALVQIVKKAQLKKFNQNTITKKEQYLYY